MDATTFALVLFLFYGSQPPGVNIVVGDKSECNQHAIDMIEQHGIIINSWKCFDSKEIHKDIHSETKGIINENSIEDIKKKMGIVNVN